ncbi:unnamed protein product [Toxocara canis]|uniref:Uncharacterized protein n=1 Tax=Toxocara canis TaxID=6265 RepID=A0A183TXN0_TOXCA|nr:unnamed protein product [Toxocara canis]
MLTLSEPKFYSCGSWVSVAANGNWNDYVSKQTHPNVTFERSGVLYADAVSFRDQQYTAHCNEVSLVIPDSAPAENRTDKKTHPPDEQYVSRNALLLHDQWVKPFINHSAPTADTNPFPERQQSDHHPQACHFCAQWCISF